MKFACIFDWDGVIIDSSKHHIEGWRRLAREEKLDFKEHLFQQSFGMKNEQIIPDLWKWTIDKDEIARLDKKKEALYRSIMIEQGITSLPGIETLLKLIKKQKIPCAIGSSAPPPNVTTGLDLLNFNSYFSTVITGADVILGKPDPSIFLLAAKRLGVAPSQCIVFEDAKVGVAAARAANMKVIAVTNTYPAHELSDATLVVDSLEHVTLDTMKSLFF